VQPNNALKLTSAMAAVSALWTRLQLNAVLGRPDALARRGPKWLVGGES
jgi:hypothetical protein